MTLTEEAAERCDADRLSVLEQPTTVRNGEPAVDAGARLPSENSHVTPDGAEAGDNVFDVATSYEGFQIQTPEDIDEWWHSLQHDAKHTNLFLEIHRSDPQAAHRLAQAVTSMPAIGSDFMGFRLLAELGRGAFARVYLAQQGDLADRFVVLKVSPDMGGESQALAQLQHTNVVPIYSLHRAGPLQAVCMPYLGATTLSSVLKELQGREVLPASGKGLVSTLVDRKSATRQDVAPAPEWTQPPAAVTPGAAEKPAESTAKQVIGSTMILEMLQKLSYVEAVLWMGTRLADGLAHAHEHGILHRDLKPANVLLTDEGQPMLLDFNLAYDTKLRFNTSAAMVGGTLPYMSPEQLVAYRAGTSSPNSNSDLYSFGVIFYELLTGQHPFGIYSGTADQILSKMIEDRLQPPPPVRRWNKAVSPAVESIVRHCLEPQAAKRYQTARELQEDLERQLENLPLRHAPEPSPWERAQKWVRRHPRLTSTTSIGLGAAVLVLALATSFVLRGSRLARLEAEKGLDQFLKGKDTVQLILTGRTNDADQLDRGIHLGREALGTYQVLDNPAWRDSARVRNLSAEDRHKLCANIGEVLIYLARATALQAQMSPDANTRDEKFHSALQLNELAEQCFNQGQSPKALWIQRAELTDRLGRNEEAKELAAKAAKLPLDSATDYFLVSAKYVAEGRFLKAIPLLEEATQKYPQSFWTWFMLGVCYDGLLRWGDAAACYTTAIAIWPEFPWTHYNRGLAHLHQQRYGQARHDFDQAIALKTDLAEAYPHRALAKLYARDFAGAEQDCERALELGAPKTQVYLIRARVRQGAGDKEGAARDQKAGLDSVPNDELGWLTRGDLLNRLGHKKEALHDFDEALTCNPRSLFALQNKSNVLSTLGRNEEALGVSNRLVELYPDYVDGRAGRGTLLARLGKLDAAHHDAKECYQRDQSARVLFQLAGIYAQTSKSHASDRQHALKLLSAALSKGFGYDDIEKDKDLDPIRDTPEFRRLVEAARVLRPSVAVASQKH